MVRALTEGDTPGRFPKPIGVASTAGDALKARLLSSRMKSNVDARELSAKPNRATDDESSTATAAGLGASVKDRVRMLEQKMSAV